MSEKDTVLGHVRELPEGRIVFVGKAESYPDRMFFGFRSAEGKDLNFSLSHEAVKEMLSLLGNPPKYGAKKYPFKESWRLVKGNADV